MFAIIENLYRSLVWLTSAIQRMKCLDCLFFQAHAACAHSSKRLKKTLLALNHEAFASINMGCPGNRRHARWGTQFTHETRFLVKNAKFPMACVRL